VGWGGVRDVWAVRKDQKAILDGGSHEGAYQKSSD
jgi:hypothetical protein